MGALIELAARCEAAGRAEKALNREIALAVGWCRQSPSEARRSNPAWFHPDDCRDGKPLIDSLHGTDVWREPSDYTGSLDAAMTLVPADPWVEIKGPRKYLNIPTPVPNLWSASVSQWNHEGDATGWGATPALALCAAVLRARATISRAQASS